MNVYHLIWILPLIALAFWFLLGLKRRGKAEEGLYSALDELGIARHLALFRYTYTTPGGVTVRSTVPVPTRALETIDEGISSQIERWNAAFPNYKKGDFLSSYSVLFVDPMAWNEFTPPGSPAILVKGIQAAGTCIGRTRSGWPLVHIVVPHQQDSNWSFEDYLMRSVWHESEHIRPSINDDLETFNKYIGAGDIHPHIP